MKTGASVEEAANKCRNAGIAALISAAITTATFMFARYSGTDNLNLEFFNDPWILFDVGAFILLALGLFAKSRTAAIILFVYYVIAQVIVRIETGNFSGIILTLVFLYFFFQGILGAFSYNRARREIEPRYRRKPIWLLSLFAVVIMGGTSLIGYGFWLERAGLATVIEGEQIPDEHVEWMEQNGILEKGEYVDLFYSSAMLSLRDDGNLLTSRGVVSYWVVEEETYYNRLDYEDVSQINLLARGSFAEFTVLEIIGRGEGVDEDTVFQIYLPGEANEDQKFISLLEERTGLKVESASAPSAANQLPPLESDGAETE